MHPRTEFSLLLRGFPGGPVLAELRTVPNYPAEPWSTRLWSLWRGGPRELFHPPRGTVGGLDFLRSLAILLVISGHVAGDYASRHGHFWLEKLPIFDFGWTGVDLFFVLSGYLIGRQLWKELHATGSIDVPGFLIRRGMRIYPYYFAFTAFMALVVDHGRPLARAVPDLLFFSNYGNGIVNGGWSLSTEEQFYLFAPALILLTRGVRFSRKYVPLVVLFALLPGIRMASYLAWKAAGSQVPLENVLVFPFHTHADGLILGLLLAWLSIAAPNVMAVRPLASNLPVPMLLIVVGVLLRQVEKHAFALTGLALLFGGMTLFILRDAGKATRWTSFRGFHLVSRLSYGMYLNHFLILPRLLSALGDGSRTDGGSNPAAVGHAHGFFPVEFAAFLLGTIAISIAMAFVTFCVVEHPFLMLRESWLKARAKAKKAASVEPASQAVG